MKIGGTFVALVAVVVLGILLGQSNGNTPGEIVSADDGAALVDNDPGARPDSARQGRPLDPGATRRVAVFGLHDGRAFEVLVSKRIGVDEQCVVGRIGGGSVTSCAKNLFEKYPVAAVSSLSAGPGGTPLRDYELFGLVSAPVERLEVVDSRGTTTTARVTKNGAFFFELHPRELASGVRAREILAYDASGALVSRVPVA